MIFENILKKVIMCDKYVELTKDQLDNPQDYSDLSDYTNGLINLDDAVIILNYTGFISKEINTSLLKGKFCSERCLELKKRFSEALIRLPSFNNQIVFRNEDDYAEKKKYEKYFDNNLGKIIRFPHFLSCSKEDWDRSVVYKIRTLDNYSLAKDISRIANNKEEKEVLFMDGANFKVVSYEYSDDDRLIVHLDESASPLFDEIFSYTTL